jgi:hypothetical protein
VCYNEASIDKPQICGIIPLCGMGLDKGADLGRSIYAYIGTLTSIGTYVVVYIHGNLDI